MPMTVRLLNEALEKKYLQENHSMLKEARLSVSSNISRSIKNFLLHYGDKDSQYDSSVLQVYVDQSGSWGIDQENLVRDILTPIRGINGVKIEVYYFAQYVETDRYKAREQGMTAALPEIMSQLNESKPDNVLIITDNDFDYFRDGGSYTAPGGVWMVFYGERSKKLMQSLKGKKLTKIFDISRDDAKKLSQDKSNMHEGLDTFENSEYATKVMFDFGHNGDYDEESIINGISDLMESLGLEFTGYVDFDDMTDAYGGNVFSEDYKSDLYDDATPHYEFDDHRSYKDPKTDEKKRIKSKGLLDLERAIDNGRMINNVRDLKYMLRQRELVKEFINGSSSKSEADRWKSLLDKVNSDIDKFMKDRKGKK